MLDEPKEVSGWSTWRKPRDLLILFKSERRVESLPCLMSSAGFMTRMVAVAMTAMMAITTRSSMRVKACSE